MKFLSIIFIFFSIHLFGQYGDLLIKQRFDDVYTVLYGPIYQINNLPNSASNLSSNQGVFTWNSSNPLNYYLSSADQNTLGSFRSSSLEALLRLYEATCDVKYLHEFMEQSTIICNLRSDKVGQSSWKYWFINSIYFHGRLLHPMTHFVYLVNSNSGLYNKVIPISHRINFANKSTFGEFSEWLNTNNKEEADFLLSRYWRDNDECMCKPKDVFEAESCKSKQGENSIMELNMQAPFGCALVYLYLVNSNEISYGVKVVEMARAYLFKHGNLLEYNGLYNAYTWHTDGWQKKSNGSLRNQFFEDIGHGSFDIMFPILYSKFYNDFHPHVTSGQYFEDYQMVRFRNTFTRIIFNQENMSVCSAINRTFDCNVYGLCFGHYYGDGVSAPTPNEHLNYQMNAKNWTGLYVYDYVSGAQPGPTVYSILMNYYINVESCLPITSANYGGVAIVGLADLVVANYDREGISCPLPPVGNNPSQRLDSSVTISPNPSSTVINIDSEIEVFQVSLVDFNGKTLIQSDSCYDIDVSKLNKGTYLVKVSFVDGTFQIEKLFIE